MISKRISTMRKAKTSQKRSPTVVVIGAGMTGLLAAIRLKEEGYNDVYVFEKASTIGGTWRENTYPGVACDIPSHMYTYSFAPNPEWNNLFARGEEIQTYLLRVGKEKGVLDQIHCNESVESCVLEAPKWRVKTSKGTEVLADFVINATGILHHPATPEFKGLDTFKGKVFHTAEWDHSFKMEGKRVGIIGTGSTAAQVIPELAKEVKHLSVFQRTPQWILHLPNAIFSEKVKEHFRNNSFSLAAIRAAETWNISNLLTKAVIGKPIQNKLLNVLCKANLRLNVKDKALREKLTPNYAVGCKRIIVNATFYPAIQRENVSLETDKIEQFVPEGIRTSDGKVHKLDAVVMATGFHAKNYMRPMNVIGKNGMHINDAWKNKIRTYRSVCMPDFPNNFLMLGPNSPIGNFSVIAISEVQMNYVLKAMDQWREGAYDMLEPKQSEVERFAQHVKKGLKNTVWTGGCQSWYLDQDGDPILWPYTWNEWEKQMSKFEPAHFHMGKVAAKPVVPKEKVAA